MKKRVMKIGILFAAAVIAVFWYRSAVNSLSKEFAGAYVSGNGLYQRMISIEPQNHAFFYTDQANGIFIKGAIEKRSSDSFFFSCEDEASSKIIENQMVVCSGLTVVVTISGSKVEFEKIEDVPIVIANASYN